MEKIVKFTYDEWDKVASCKPEPDIMVDRWLKEDYGLQFILVDDKHQTYKVIDQVKYLAFVLRWDN